MSQTHPCWPVGVAPLFFIKLGAGCLGASAAVILMSLNAPSSDEHVVNNTVVHAERGIYFVDFNFPASLTGDIRTLLRD